MSHRLRHTTPIVFTALAWVSGGMVTALGLGLIPGTLAPPMAQEATPAPTPTPSQEIADIQRRLQRLGHYQGPIDGLFGEATRAAIARFQGQANLARTGILDPLTQSRLDAVIAPNSIPAAPLDPPPADPAPPAPTEFNFNLSGVGDEEEAASTPSTDGATEGGGQEAAEGITAPPGETTPPPAARPSRWPLIAMGLIGLALALTLGGAALWLLLRRPPAEGDGAEGDGADRPPRDPFGEDPIALANGHSYRDPFGDGPMPGARQRSPQPAPEISTPNPPAPEPTPVTPAAAPVASTLQSLPQPEPTPDPGGAIAPQPETQRLAKVNIVDALIADLQSPDPTLRRKAIWELGQRGNSQAMQPLLGLMVGADSQERSLILATLSEISSRTLKPLNRALALSLQDENPEVRKNAIRDLTRIYDLMGQVGSLLTHAATDEDLEVRQTALWAMEQFSRLRLQAAGGDSPDRLPGAPPRDSLPHDRPH